MSPSVWIYSVVWLATQDYVETCCSISLTLLFTGADLRGKFYTLIICEITESVTQFYCQVTGLNDTIHAKGRCIWYGQCKETSSGKWLNCYNNTVKVHVEDNSEMYDKLQSVCPWYIGKQPNSTFSYLL